jgi:hypothetical protein
MSEPVIQANTGTVSQPVTEQPKPDLITRASQVKVEPKSIPVTEPDFDYKEIEAIKDPVAKEVALKAYKSFQRGFNQKFQDIASLRKDLENKSQEFSNWTPERVQQLINDPKFVDAAKNVVGTQQEQTYETETDKRVKALEQELNQLKGQSVQQIFKQQDETIGKKYANYDPKKVDEITADMLSNKVQATREHLWKVLDYDEAVQRAYQLGLQDKQLNLNDKISSASYSPNSPTITSNGEKPEPMKGETDRAFFQRLFQQNSEKLQRK